MALADFLKAFSLSESSVKGSSPSTATQVVGLLSVLAISGSVALFTLGSRLRAPSAADLASVDTLEQTELGETNEGTDGSRQEASEPSKRINRVRKASGKRVRFAEDVIEPQGNGHEYRTRYAQEQRQPEERKKRQPSSSIPANRMALYKGILQQRLQHSAAYFS